MKWTMVLYFDCDFVVHYFTYYSNKISQLYVVTDSCKIETSACMYHIFNEYVTVLYLYILKE
jgi:hypothetical protein